MFTEAFKASTKYGDFKGTSQVDNADRNSPREFLQTMGFLRDAGEIVLGIEAHTGEMHGRFDDPIAVTFYLAQKGDHESVKAMIDAANGPVMVRRINIDMAIADFLGLFKRFSIAFSSHAMLEGRKITYLDY
ncbi:hypothetical protein SAMN05216567_10122 [Variovorax sp. OK605]|uniref:hypothetical protein n=1 Tax=Variovorax sp. OK605 TaxID=1855317 RepID=UPI0008DFDA57|nr:hypothetical protein [Variovorax sp. OK605]SFO51378.1 hypothetical protein SAMN05216567_10122 [Variovorax sp. OK605]